MKKLFLIGLFLLAGCSNNPTSTQPGVGVTPIATPTPSPGSGSGTVYVTWSWPSEPSTGCRTPVYLDGNVSNYIEMNSAGGTQTFSNVVYGMHTFSAGNDAADSVTISQYIDAASVTLTVIVGSGCPPAPITEEFIQ